MKLANKNSLVVENCLNKTNNIQTTRFRELYSKTPKKENICSTSKMFPDHLQNSVNNNNLLNKVANNLKMDSLEKLSNNSNINYHFDRLTLIDLIQRKSKGHLILNSNISISTNHFQKDKDKDKDKNKNKINQEKLIANSPNQITIKNHDVI